jgi:hypothetical protein
MTLDEQLLQKLAKWRPDSGRQTLDVSDPATGWTVRLTADCVDQIGSRLHSLGLSRTTPLEGVSLRDRAEALAARVTGLMEPLRLIEVDTPRNTALLRSEAPGERGDDLYYYEILLQGDGGSQLHRYQASHQSHTRQAVPFSLTHEVLGKLVSDLTAPA